MINNLSNTIQPMAGDFTGRARPANIEQAAEQFEAMFLRQMLREMRKSADVLSGENGLFSSRESRTLRDFYDDVISQDLASQRSTGIANLLIQQLSPRKD